MRKFKVTFRFPCSRELLTQIVKADNYGDAEKQVIEMYDDGIQINEVFDLFEQSIVKKQLCVDMPDGFTYAIPIMAIAENRANYYAKEYDGEDAFYMSMIDDTLPLFTVCENEIVDWAENNMNWSDLEPHATRIIKTKDDYDMQSAWLNNPKSIK